ncbi:hypothetical protein GEMMAAP_01320 [Gemmatimonas phototrophica]|uniref:LamG-like jellyroll fold domain-containing protein n=2 Tax=Gemmatimonas phototrophica TaxID=1379270 RepID=A0A143BGW0_9BACT|nr:hypothetical protein GEMMAAP_01320 [Gemmatimonas phototrophica]
MSMSVWVRQDVLHDGYISAKEGYWRGKGIVVLADGSVLYSNAEPEPQGYFTLVTEPGLLGANTWHHIVSTFEPGIIRVYVDGVLRGTASGPYNTFNFSWLAAGNSTATNLIGATHPVDLGIVGYFRGDIDDLAVWGRTLSATEVATLSKWNP